MATPITIKRYGTSGWDTLYPITTGQNVYGSGTKATTALLDSNNKLARDFLQLYEHNVSVRYSTHGISVTFKFITNSSTSLTYATLVKTLYDRGYISNTTVCPACGFYGNSNMTALVNGVYGYNSTSDFYLGFRYIPLVSYDSTTGASTIRVSPDDKSTSVTLSSSYTIEDKVITI